MTNTLKLGIAGLGTVGCGVIDLLNENGELIASRCGKKLEVVAVSSRDKSRDRDINVDGLHWHSDALEMASNPDVDVVLELIGGSEGIAKELVEKSLKAGKHVVTANKALVAHHGAELVKLATDNNVTLMFEAAVAGGIPVVKSLREGLSANKINHIAGILNGTCNYILTEMESSGRSFDDVLVEAQELGYAEADPSFDVDGVDAAHKLAILSSLAFGVQPTMDNLYIEGIRNITYGDILFARNMGYSIRLLGITKESENGVERRVHPCLVPANLPLGRVEGVFNAVQFEASPVDRIFLEGRGAGAGPTASSVVADLVDIARDVIVPPLNVSFKHLQSDKFSSMGSVQTRYYLRLSVIDEAGVMAEISGLLSRAGISLEALVQPPHTENEHAQIVLITHEMHEKTMQAVIEDIAALDAVIKTPQMIRIESP